MSGEASAPGRARVDAAALARWMALFAERVASQRERLTALDAAIGDADHGVNLDRGLQALVAKLPTLAPADPAALLETIGMTLMSRVGGASGALYGTLFLQMAAAAAGASPACSETSETSKSVADARRIASSLDLQGWAAAFARGVDGVVARGKAAPGEKTMLDALLPAVAALRSALDRGEPPAPALASAAQAARDGAAATVPMVARKGRASYLGERSRGHEDPGAASSALLVEAAACAFEQDPRGRSGGAPPPSPVTDGRLRGEEDPAETAADGARPPVEEPARPSPGARGAAPAREGAVERCEPGSGGGSSPGE